MKREIYCVKCQHEDEQLFPNGIVDNFGERIKYIKGTAKADYKCDLCDKDILQGNECFAVSTWIEGNTQYYSWEPDYLTISDSKDLINEA